MIAYIGSENNIGCACKINDSVNDTIMYLFFNKKVKDKCNRIIRTVYLRLVISRRTADGGENTPGWCL